MPRFLGRKSTVTVQLVAAASRAQVLAGTEKSALADPDSFEVVKRIAAPRLTLVTTSFSVTDFLTFVDGKVSGVGRAVQTTRR